MTKQKYLWWVLGSGALSASYSNIKQTNVFYEILSIASFLGRSISPDYKRKSNRRRSYSRSPTSDRRRLVSRKLVIILVSRIHSISIHLQENPQKSRCLGVFGLNVFTTREQIIKIFERYGTIDRVEVVIDAKVSLSGCCWFFFLYIYLRLLSTLKRFSFSRLVFLS